MGLVLVILLIGEWGKGVPFKQNLINQDTSVKFRKNNDLWIPPRLPNETSCWGCCLIPTIGGLITHESFKKGIHADSLQLMSEPQLDIGFNYSLGVAYTGEDLRSAKGEDIFQNPSWWTYWNNLLEIVASYYFNPNWTLGLGCGCMWTHLKNTVFRFDIYTDPWMSVSEDRWGIYSGFGRIGFENKSYGKSTNRILGAGLEYYFSIGIAKENMGRYNPQADTSEYRCVEGKIFNKGMGIFFLIGFEKVIMPPVVWHATFILRHGIARNYKQKTIQEDIVWTRPIDINFNFSGLYLKVGISYKFFKERRIK